MEMYGGPRVFDQEEIPPGWEQVHIGPDPQKRMPATPEQREGYFGSPVRLLQAKLENDTCVHLIAFPGRHFHLWFEDLNSVVTIDEPGGLDEILMVLRKQHRRLRLVPGWFTAWFDYPELGELPDINREVSAKL